MDEVGRRGAHAPPGSRRFAAEPRSNETTSASQPFGLRSLTRVRAVGFIPEAAFPLRRRKTDVGGPLVAAFAAFGRARKNRRARPSQPIYRSWVHTRRV